MGLPAVATRQPGDCAGHEENASLAPAGTGPCRLVEIKQGSFYRYKAVQNHWRQTPALKELIIRKIPNPAAGLSALRAGEVDIMPVSGDFLKQVEGTGFRLIDSSNAIEFWMQLPGQTIPQFEDYCPRCPWVGDINDPKSQENALKVRLAMNLAVDKQAGLKSQTWAVSKRVGDWPMLPYTNIGTNYEYLKPARS